MGCLMYGIVEKWTDQCTVLQTSGQTDVLQCREVDSMSYCSVNKGTDQFIVLLASEQTDVWQCREVESLIYVLYLVWISE